MARRAAYIAAMTTELRPKPIQYAACYAMDLYCQRTDVHNVGSYMEQFTGETFAECAKAAKKRGWHINRKTRLGLCARCQKLGHKDGEP